MKCIQGQSVLQISKDLKIRPNTVIDWRRRFQRGGIAGLHDLPRSGKPPIYGQEFRDKVLETLEQAPPAGQAVWDGHAVAERDRGISACGMESLKERRNMSKSPAKLVCEY